MFLEHEGNVTQQGEMLFEVVFLFAWGVSRQSCLDVRNGKKVPTKKLVWGIGDI